MLTWTFERLPRVEPPTMSLLLAKACTGTPASAHTPSKTARLKASVQYFWLAASFTTMPPLSTGWLAAS